MEKHVRVEWDFKWREFDLQDEKDGKDYRITLDQAVNGWFYVHKQQHITDPATGRMRYVYLEWSQRYGELAETAPESLRSVPHVPPQQPRYPLAGHQSPDAA